MLHADWSQIEQAIRLVSSVMPRHEDLIKPTLLHSIQAGMLLYDHGYSSTIVIAGILHDILEDTHITYDQLISEFGTEVAQLVSLNTKQEHLPKDQVLEELFQRCSSSHNAYTIKASDIITNYDLYVTKGYHPEKISRINNLVQLRITYKPSDYISPLEKILAKIV